jgi:superfamily II DNA or RNA helicase
VRIDEVEPAIQIEGAAPGTVTVVAVERMSPDAITVTFRHDDGRLTEQLAFAQDTAGWRRADDRSRWSFTADGARFKLAAEATRMRMAGLFDPMLAVATSTVEPLPHQIRAVYEELLPKPGPLRFLLADDPGAGKTIMAGLYMKELLLRGDVARCLVVAPGGLVEQWQTELAEKFGLEFAILTRSLADADLAGDPFQAHPLLIARMDQLARADAWLEALRESEWDLVVVDEAHRMSAHYYGNELTRTRRYELGQLLGSVTRHLLLMTATPHAGKEEDFQLFMALLDPDRFEGPYRAGVHSTDTRGIMRRMVKEDLLTFDGKPLFPERVAETVTYALSPLEAELYEAVTEYVRTEMNRADRLADEGNTGRRRTVGFALTVLQRRLASSPEAIFRSLQRRSERLRRQRDALVAGPAPRSDADEPKLGAGFDEDEYDAEELEELEDEVVDAATAARTAAELDVELAVLSELETLAARVRAAGHDRKWQELRELVLEARENGLASAGQPHKLIVFTEHRDTLTYLASRLASVLGSPDAVVTIHGGTHRQERRRIRETFTNDPECQVLVATDAAGEGLNLQAAHLMVNYDLPWNPNRIEQRFGRVHRIGQREVCRLWNLVAEDTREGQVFRRLLDKIEEQRRAYGGSVFDVLGENAFAERPLRDLLLDAIRYGEQPEVRARLDQVIDASVARGLEEVLQERALATPQFSASDLATLRREMDEARARRLQPHYIQLFVLEALHALGGRWSAREQGRFEVTHVPASLRNVGAGAVRRAGGRLSTRPVAARYARITFEPALVDGRVSAELVAPGHPLMDALVDAVLERWGGSLTEGATLVDDTAAEPRLVVAVKEELVDGTGAALSRRFDFVELAPDGGARLAGPAPYLDVRSVGPEHAVAPELGAVRERLVAQSWLGPGVDALAQRWAVAHGLPAHRSEVAARTSALVDRTRRLVRQRLTAQMNYWDAEAVRLAEDQAAGRRIRLSPTTASERARALEARLERRERELALAEQVQVRPPRIAGAALVVPGAWLTSSDDAAVPSRLAVDTSFTDKRAVAAVLAAERALGRVPEEMPHNNKGYDIRSAAPDGTTVFVEVKGRVLGADDYVVTASEVLLGKNAEPHYRLALVAVDPDAPPMADGDPNPADVVRYVLDPFRDTTLGTYADTAVIRSWKRDWERGVAPR